MYLVEGLLKNVCWYVGPCLH